MKHCFIILLLELCSTALVLSQGTLREFVVEKDDSKQVPQVIYKDKGCTPDDGVIVFYTSIPDLKFSMPDTPNRLKNVSPFDRENNCYVLCVQPTDTRIGGIMLYSISITGNEYKPISAFMVSGITSGAAQYFKIKIEEDWKSAFERLEKKIAELTGENNEVASRSDEQNLITDHKIVEQVIEKTPELVIANSGGRGRNGEVSNPDGIELIYVEGKGGIKDFYIGKYEVTQEQWIVVMGSNPSRFKGDNLPVESVSWNDVHEFLSRLNELTGRNYRLPSQDEWEFAARGGTANRFCPDGCKYSGSNKASDVAWYFSNSRKRTHPVGTKQPNELGVYDMSGNVWEWCEDGNRSSRVIRGGSWNNDSYCSVAYSTSTDLNNRYNNIGFRVVLP